MKNKLLYIDVETYSSRDLAKGGVYNYAASADFKILLLSYALGGGEIRAVDLVNGRLPGEFLEAFKNENTTLVAHNANFERVCLNAHGLYTKSSRWECSMVVCLLNGLPGALGNASTALKLGVGKDPLGERLIKLFSRPDRDGRMTDPGAHPDQWRAFTEYCKRDVEVERLIHARLAPLQPFERSLYDADQAINDRGVLADIPFAGACVEVDALYKAEVMETLGDLTGLANPNSLTQMKAWIKEATGLAVKSLTGETTPGLIERMTLLGHDAVAEVLEKRGALTKTSVAKYRSMLEVAGQDDRMRGTLQMCGASRTGRYAGRRVQLQNTPRSFKGDVELAREDIKNDGVAGARRHGEPLEVLSQMIRPALIASEGKTLIVCDYSSIEPRVLAWLAGDEEKLELFRTHGLLYEQTAAELYNKPIAEVTKAERSLGKVATLAFGYQGAGGAFFQMEKATGTDFGFSPVQVSEVVRKWRAANPRVVALWAELERVAKGSLYSPGFRPAAGGLLSIGVDPVEPVLSITLPSGRKIQYWNPREASFTVTPKNGKPFKTRSLCYEGSSSTKGSGFWETQQTYGGKLVENVTQAVARDLFTHALERLEGFGFKTVFHVHDEVVVEAPLGINPRAVEEVMNDAPGWAGGIPLASEAFASRFYKK